MQDAAPEPLSRRSFLATAAAAAAGAAAAPAGAFSPRGPTDRPIGPLVAHASGNHLVRGRLVHEDLLAEILDQTLATATGQATATAAWQSLLRPDDLIGLKFNRSAARELGVTEPFARAVVRSLTNAGFETRQIVLIEVEPELAKQLETTPAELGFDSAPSDFGSGADRLARVLDQVTALVNVPFLKTHNLAGITCCLKNLSHGLIMHPAQFHQNHCTPYISDICALARIQKKIRFHLVNGLRVVFDRGPGARDEFTWDAGKILAGTDPVAIDALGVEIINSQRRIRALPPVDEPIVKTTFLDRAQRVGLGVGQPHKIRVARVDQ